MKNILIFAIVASIAIVVTYYSIVEDRSEPNDLLYADTKR